MSAISLASAWARSGKLVAVISASAVTTAALKAAGIKDFRFHDLRHTAATRALRESGNLKVVQQLLGHADIATTARYAHAMTDDVRDVMEAMEAMESRNNTEVESRKSGKTLKVKGE